MMHIETQPSIKTKEKVIFHLLLMMEILFLTCNLLLSGKQKKKLHLLESSGIFKAFLYHLLPLIVMVKMTQI